MEKIIAFLDGKKSFIGIGVGVLYSVLIELGVLTSSEVVWAALIGWTGISFRLAIKK